MFGKNVPHWVHDAVGFLGTINLLAFFPTVIAIAFAPRHFISAPPANNGCNAACI
jgi:hypothetical protein